MRKMRKLILTCALLGAVTGSALAQSEGVRSNALGPQLGVYLPNSKAVRDRFGDKWVGYGLGIGPLVAPQRVRKTNFDFTVLSARRTFGSATLIPVGFSYRQALTPAKEDEVPRSGTYAGVSANLLVSQLQSTLPADNLPRAWRTSAGGSFFVGAVVSERLSVEARYYTFGKIKGLDFSGLALNLGLRF
jgi:hypothetical protein